MVGSQLPAGSLLIKPCFAQPSHMSTLICVGSNTPRARHTSLHCIVSSHGSPTHRTEFASQFHACANTQAQYQALSVFASTGLRHFFLWYVTQKKHTHVFAHRSFAYDGPHEQCEIIPWPSLFQAPTWATCIEFDLLLFLVCATPHDSFGAMRSRNWWKHEEKKPCSQSLGFDDMHALGSLMIAGPRGRCVSRMKTPQNADGKYQER